MDQYVIPLATEMDDVTPLNFTPNLLQILAQTLFQMTPQKLLPLRITKKKVIVNHSQIRRNQIGSLMFGITLLKYWVEIHIILNVHVTIVVLIMLAIVPVLARVVCGLT